MSVVYYRPQTKFAKVMFLQVSVGPQRGGEACVVAWGGGGACVVALGGACVVDLGGQVACVVALWGHAWFFPGGGHA